MATPAAKAPSQPATRRVEVPHQEGDRPGRRQGPHLAAPGARRVPLRHRDHRPADRLVAAGRRAARGAGQPDAHAEPVEGAVVLPRPAGDAGLLRSRGTPAWCCPSFIIVGLMVIPYIDINPKGNGYYCFEERKFEILTFFFGFHVLWISLIIIGTFLRGPGWNWFWPWQKWDLAQGRGDDQRRPAVPARLPRRDHGRRSSALVARGRCSSSAASSASTGCAGASRAPTRRVHGALGHGRAS